jgi:PPOX class probable F420-dependent enzyme
VWFLWDGEESVLMYSMPSARIANLQANPRVTLNFAGDGHGGDIVVFSGAATVDRELPRADANESYLSKYREGIARIGSTPEAFASDTANPCGSGSQGCAGTDRTAGTPTFRDARDRLAASSPIRSSGSALR